VWLYNTERCHSARQFLPPTWDKPPELQSSVALIDVVCTSRLGGLLRSYSRRAA
jgi:hypothetical protein